MDKIKSNNRLNFGILLVVAGLFFLLGKMGIIPDAVYDALTRWPMIFVIIGVVNLINREFTAATIFLVIGGYFLFSDFFNLRYVWDLWPVLLIFVGLMFIFKQNRRIKNLNLPVNSEDVIDEVAIFGGREVKVESQNFMGGKITSIFGGSDIHLLNARMSDQGAVIDMVAIFGGTKIYIPRDWTVKTDVVSIFGAFTDKRLYFSESSDASKVLYIKGTVIFGGGELVNL